MWKLIICLLISQAVCLGNDDKVRVQSYVLPEYHPELLKDPYQGMGTARVTAEIGKDGKVKKVIGPIFPKDGFSGAYLTLVDFAAKSLCQWTFYLPSGQKTFPVRYTVEYVFKQEGKPVPTPNPRYLIEPPDRITITSAPMLTKDKPHWDLLAPPKGKIKPMTYKCPCRQEQD